MYNLVANVINIIGNYLLIEGNLGFPRMEVAGAVLGYNYWANCCFCHCIGYGFKAGPVLAASVSCKFPAGSSPQ